MLKFLYYYLRSMRLYYGFVTATTVLVGLCLVRFGTGGGRGRGRYATPRS